MITAVRADACSGCRALLLLTGAAHSTSPLGRLALQHSKLTIIPDRPHSLYWERGDVFNRAVHQFLETIYAG